MDQRNNIIFELILDSRSLTAIGYTAEDELAKPMDSEDRALLEQIKGLNSLDEIWIICHTRLSNWHLKCAGEIRAFIETKKGRRENGIHGKLQNAQWDGKRDGNGAR